MSIITPARNFNWGGRSNRSERDSRQFLFIFRKLGVLDNDTYVRTDMELAMKSHREEMTEHMVRSRVPKKGPGGCE